jgi:nucleoside-diphosphate-sugar epimerase
MKKYQNNDFPITIVRPSHTYNTILPIIAPWSMNYGFIERLKQGKKVFLHKDGNSLWTLTHAADFARGFIGLLGNPQSIGHSFHITSDEILTWNQIYEIMAEAVGVKLNIVYIPIDFIASRDPEIGDSLTGDKAFNMLFDNSKIKQFVPNFKCKIPFSEGILDTLKWFEADPARMRVDPEAELRYDQIISAYESQMTSK